MLVLGREAGERIVITTRAGERIVMTFLRYERRQAKFAFEAERDVRIDREEILPEHERATLPRNVCPTPLTSCRR